MNVAEGPAIATRVTHAGLDWIVPPWKVSANVQAVVTTRNGAVWSGGRRIMDLGGTEDTDTTVLESRKYLRRFLPGEPHWLRQVHGANVVVLDAASSGDGWPVADAAVTCTPGVVCAVRTADCLPVFFADRSGRAVAVAHAGWRGLASGVLRAAIDTMTRLGSPPETLVAWLGPAISPAAFEVGAEVRDALLARDDGASECFAPGRCGKWQADLYALATRQLASGGVNTIAGGGFCTYVDARRFFSWRRDHATARMAALIWLAP